MSVNAINSATEAYSSYSDTSVKAPAPSVSTATEEPKKPQSEGVVYEHGSVDTAPSTSQIYTKNSAVIKQLKADAEESQSRLMSYVQQMLSGQGNALAQSDDVWKFLASGNYTVTEAAKKQAEEAISEDGYWGVNKTSDRIIEFAKALSGGDPSKIDSLKEAFQKGFSEATKTWGKELPDISSKTFDAVMKKFDDWKNEGNTPTTNPITNTETQEA